MMSDKALEEYTRMSMMADELCGTEKDIALKAVLTDFAYKISRMKEVVRKISRTELMEKESI